MTFHSLFRQAAKDNSQNTKGADTLVYEDIEEYSKVVQDINTEIASDDVVTTACSVYVPTTCNEKDEYEL